MKKLTITLKTTMWLTYVTAISLCILSSSSYGKEVIFEDDLSTPDNFIISNDGKGSNWTSDGKNLIYLNQKPQAPSSFATGNEKNGSQQKPIKEVVFNLNGQARCESINNFSFNLSEENDAVVFEFTSHMSDWLTFFEVSLIDTTSVARYDSPLALENDVYGFSVIHTAARSARGLLFNDGVAPSPKEKPPIDVKLFELKGTHSYRVEFTTEGTTLFRDGVRYGTSHNTLDLAREYKLVVFAQGSGVEKSLNHVSLAYAKKTIPNVKKTLSYPILEIKTESKDSAEDILQTWTDQEYIDAFVPRQPARLAQDMKPVVPGDHDWEWSALKPNQITSIPSGTVFPNDTYPILYEKIKVLTGETVVAPYYKAVDGSKSRVFSIISMHKHHTLKPHLFDLTSAYLASGDTHQSRRQDYARRLAMILNDWAKYCPRYFITKNLSMEAHQVDPDFIVLDHPKAGRGHRSPTGEWHDNLIFAYDAIHDSPALESLSKELNYNARQHIREGLLETIGNYLAYHYPIYRAHRSNLSGHWKTLGYATRVLGREDYMVWLDEYLQLTLRNKIHRDGGYSESPTYAYNYLKANLAVAQRNKENYSTWPPSHPHMVLLEKRSKGHLSLFEDGLKGWKGLALPSGVLPSHGDTGISKVFDERDEGSSYLMPAYGALSLGAGTGQNKIQMNQTFLGRGHHARREMTAMVLYVDDEEWLCNDRYPNGAGRKFGAHVISKNAVTIDRTNIPLPSTKTYGKADLMIYEPKLDGLMVSELDAGRSYEDMASRYQRILMMNTHDNSQYYLIDVMRITGGKVHDYTWHGSLKYDQTWSTTANTTALPEERPLLEDGEVWKMPKSHGDSFPVYGMWENVSSGKVNAPFNFTFSGKTKKKRDLRFWMPIDDDAELFIGELPVGIRGKTINKKGYWSTGHRRPSTIVRRKTKNGELESLYVSVIEPKREETIGIKSVERIPVKGNKLEACILRITFEDGRVDTCLINLHHPDILGAKNGSKSISSLDESYSLDGRIGVISQDGANSKTWAIGATSLQHSGVELLDTAAGYKGKIEGETRIIAGAEHHAFITKTKLPVGTALRGEHLSLTFGSLQGYDIDGISEMFVIDRVLEINGEYHICFTQDHQLEITEEIVAVEQIAPARTFVGELKFEIVLGVDGKAVTPVN